jgi:hypothetical protein
MVWHTQDLVDGIVLAEQLEFISNKLGCIVRLYCPWEAVTRKHFPQLSARNGRRSRFNSYDVEPFGVGIDNDQPHMSFKRAHRIDMMRLHGSHGVFLEKRGAYGTFEQTR